MVNKKYKVGDKVYVHPGESSRVCYIRATITELDDGVFGGYELRAFEQDLPGIFMFNVWDDELLPRDSKKEEETS
jgi:hypothetical protein